MSEEKFEQCEICGDDVESGLIEAHYEAHPLITMLDWGRDTTAGVIGRAIDDAVNILHNPVLWGHQELTPERIATIQSEITELQKEWKDTPNPEELEFMMDYLDQAEGWLGDVGLFAGSNSDQGTWTVHGPARQ